MKHFLVWISVTALTVSLSTAVADVAVPDYRGDDNSTCQEWDFLTGGAPLGSYFAPDGTEGITYTPYPYGSPLEPYAQVAGTYAPSTGPGPGGAWSNYTADLFIFNSVDLSPESYKLLRVQATFLGDPPTVEIQSAGQTWTPSPATTIPISGGWSVFVQDWRGEPNPQSERVILSSAGQLSEVIVDTVCIPEPATVALLAAGLLLIRRRRTPDRA